MSTSREITSWTKEDKHNAAVAFIFHGRVPEVEEATGIPRKTLYRWVKADWWPQVLDQARREHQELIEARLSTITDKVTEELIDRVENGDMVLKYNRTTKEYEYVRIPIKAKELGAIMDKLGNQLRVVRNQPTKLTAELKFDGQAAIREFAKLGKQNRDTLVIDDAEYTVLDNG